MGRPSSEHAVLHVTNGDSARALIERSGVEGDVLAWRDALHDGPVPADLGPAALRHVRAAFLSGVSGAPAAVLEAELAARDAALEGRGRRHVVLWFEHDLYDQLQLVQVLDRLGRDGARGTEVSLISVDRFPGRARFAGLGELEPAEIATLWPSRAPVGVAQYGPAREAWAAFRSPDPTALETILRTGDVGALPFLAAALRRHLEQLPWRGDGLSRTERALLRRLGDGPATPVELFRAQAAQEEAPFLGDTTVWWLLSELASGPAPLVAPVTTAAQDRPGDVGDPFGGRALALTEVGRRVVDARADRIRLRGLDRHLGGVHLHGGDVWRWDPDAARLVPPAEGQGRPR